MVTKLQGAREYRKKTAHEEIRAPPSLPPIPLLVPWKGGVSCMVFFTRHTTELGNFRKKERIQIRKGLME